MSHNFCVTLFGGPNHGAAIWTLGRSAMECERATLSGVCSSTWQRVRNFKFDKIWGSLADVLIILVLNCESWGDCSSGCVDVGAAADVTVSTVPDGNGGVVAASNPLLGYFLVALCLAICVGAMLAESNSRRCSGQGGACCAELRSGSGGRKDAAGGGGRATVNRLTLLTGSAAGVSWWNWGPGAVRARLRYLRVWRRRRRQSRILQHELRFVIGRRVRVTEDMLSDVQEEESSGDGSGAAWTVVLCLTLPNW